MQFYHSHEKKSHKDLSNGKIISKKENTEIPKNPENPAGFKCNLCGSVVRLLSDFEVHKNLHKTAIRGQCNLCLKQFSSLSSLLKHKRVSHSYKTL